MAVCALDPMDIVRAGGVEVGGVHLLYIDSAMGHLRMAGFARCLGVLIVAEVAGNAAQAFMHAHRRAVVAGAYLRTPVMRGGNGSGVGNARGVALVADGFALVFAHLYRAVAIIQFRNGKRDGGKVDALAAVKKGE